MPTIKKPTVSEVPISKWNCVVTQWTASGFYLWIKWLYNKWFSIELFWSVV